MYIGKNDNDISQKIIKEKFKLPYNIPISKACLNLLEGLLQKNPQLRIDLNSDLIDAWLNDSTFEVNNKKKKAYSSNLQSSKSQSKLSDDMINLKLNIKEENLDIKKKNNTKSTNISNGSGEVVDTSNDNEATEAPREPAKFDHGESDNSTQHKKSLVSHNSQTTLSKPKMRHSIFNSGSKKQSDITLLKKIETRKTTLGGSPIKKTTRK